MTNQKTLPAYLATAALIQSFVDANGIQLVPQAQTIDGVGGNKGWACFEMKDTGHKIYVPRSADVVGPLHTTVAVPEGTEGLVSHLNRKGEDARPGKIESFFSPEPRTLENLLVLWASTSERLRASRAPVRRGASQATTGEHAAASAPEALSASTGA